MLSASRKSQLGLNLVELMIGLVVGLIVLAAMSSVYLTSVRGSTDTINANRLNQDMRAVMDIMVSDIRRSGYWGAAVADTVNPFTARTGSTTDIYTSANCILYSYDATYNGGTAGTADAGTDFFGFQLSGNAVQMVNPGFNLSSTSTACNTANLWRDLTDSNVLQVSTLTFTTTGSQCLAYEQASYDPSVANTYVTWSVTGGTEPACTSTATGAPSFPVTTGAGATADTFIETRQIGITMTATHVRDNSLTRTLTESVLVRNNRIITP